MHLMSLYVASLRTTKKQNYIIFAEDEIDMPCAHRKIIFDQHVSITDRLIN